MSADREALLARYGFPLDDFQREAVDALDAGQSVLVAAPTGSGKTVVAEYAIARALAEGRRAFYTTPIKALSNQKFHDLIRIHGPDNVGLLTGDNSINGDAPVVVMTTEVLRNMIYGRAGALEQLGVVVLDEVHYIQDTYRGPVWEEVIIHLPHGVGLVCLSATVSNAEELADWISTVRGPTATVIEERRPVTLQNLYLIGDKTSERLHLFPTLVDGRPNPEAAKLDDEAVRGWRGGANRHRARRRLYTPRRVEAVERLEQEGMLPAIYFIFSRNACDDAARVCLDAGVRLTTGPERDRIRDIVDDHLGAMDDHDLAILGYGRFLASLENGIAAHHAGMVPPFKEAVEHCFVEGLVKVVFATETLAVGINMPARSVVIEKLTKFTGEHHTFLTPGDYTQLTGRAGRRGIDTIGNAIVLWSPFVPFDQVAALASSRSFNLRSAFRPTYNMAANLVRAYSAERAHHLLNLSFAQYQADREVVRLETRLERREAVLEELQEAATSPFGDLQEYRRLNAPTPGLATREVDEALARLRPGDIVVVRQGRHRDRAAVLAVAHRKGGLRVRAITPDRTPLLLGPSDFDEPPRPVGHLELPVPFTPNRQGYQREVARMLERAKLTPGPTTRRRPGGDGTALVDGHPVTADPRLKDRLRAAAQAERVGREVDDLRTRVTSRSESLARRFDRVLRLLGAWGYLDGWSLTDAGARLARCFHECDLLVVEALRQGHLDDLEPSELAALVSVFTYEHRSPEAPPAPWFPSGRTRKRWVAIEALARELNAAEDEAGLALTRSPDPTFAAVAYAWAAGESFAEVVEAEELSGGDFVRNVKQVIDLLRQVSEVAPEAATREAALVAADQLFRGVVAASTRVDDVEVEPVTIAKGEAWGSVGPEPAATVAVADDRAARAVVEQARRAGAAPPPLRLGGGDLQATLGGPRVPTGPTRSPAAAGGADALLLPADLGSVLLDGRQHWFVAHLVARRSWWRGRVVAVMNAQYVGRFDVAPRAHPDDGRLDVVDVTPGLGWRQRWQARRRLPTGTHVPHPGIAVQRITAWQTTFDPPLPVWLDGDALGPVRQLAVRVEPDAVLLVA